MANLTTNEGQTDYAIGLDGVMTTPATALWEWHIGPGDVNDPNATTFAGSYVNPTTANGTFYISASSIPSKMFGKAVHITSIIVYYNTNASGDDFDFDMARDNHAGGTNTESNATQDNVGNGETGNASAEMITSGGFTMHDDRVYHVKIDANNTDTANDVRIYDIKVQGYLKA